MKLVALEAVPFLPGVDHGPGCIEMMVRVEAPATCTSRVPIDLVAVVACSSVMNGGATPPSSADNKPTNLDLLRRALSVIVKQLRDGDSLAVVVPERSTDLLKISGSTSGRGSVEKEVDKLMVATNGGAPLKSEEFQLEHAVGLLVGRSAEKSNERLGFIVLLSDGGDDLLSREVEWYKTKCPHRKKYAVHTFGLGAAHDPKLLFSVARESGGTYSFVSNPGDIIEALGVCLGGLKSVAAVDTRIKIIIVPGAADITGIQGLFNLRMRSLENTSVEVLVGTLYAGEVKSFKVEIKHVASKSPIIITVDGEFKHTPASPWQPIRIIPKDKPCVIVNRHAKIYPGMLTASSRVARLRAQIKVLEMVDAFRSQMTDGAARRSAAGTLQDEWTQLNQEEALVVALSKDHSVYLKKLEDDINAMDADLNGGRGAAYLHSWLSSYGMQRATTVGSPGKQPAATASFLTQKMKDELAEVKRLVRKEVRDRLTEARKTATAVLKEKEAGVKKQPMPGAEEAQAPAGDRPKEECHAVLDLGAIERRLEVWDKLKDDTPLLFMEVPGAAAGDLDTTDALRKESIENIDRAMHKDIYLAVQHAKQKRCNTLPTPPASREK
ncbi:unnamed protein product [Urochloa humidicola]